MIISKVFFSFNLRLNKRIIVSTFVSIHFLVKAACKDISINLPETGLECLVEVGVLSVKVR